MVKGNETITVGCIYDDNRNPTRTLTKLEELLDKIDARQGLVIGGDYNLIVNPLLDLVRGVGAVPELFWG